MKLPSDLTASSFDAFLVQHAVVHFIAQRQLGELRDSSIETRPKIALILSRDTTTDEVLACYFTTQLERFENRRNERNILRLGPKDCPFLHTDSVLNLRNLVTFRRDRLLFRYQSGDLTFKEPPLAAAIVMAVQKSILACPLIPPRQKLLILAAATK